MSLRLAPTSLTVFAFVCVVRLECWTADREGDGRANNGHDHDGAHAGVEPPGA